MRVESKTGLFVDVDLGCFAFQMLDDVPHIWNNRAMQTLDTHNPAQLCMVLRQCLHNVHGVKCRQMLVRLLKGLDSLINN